MSRYNDEVDIWVAGITAAWHEENTERIPDAFVIESIRGAPSTDFLRRHKIMDACFAAAPNASLPKLQAQRLIDSCLEVAKRFGREQMSRWKDKATRAQQTCQELLTEQEQPRPKRRSKKKRRAECVICLDAKPAYTFRPCGHCVTCAACAKAVFASSSTCPWCRGELTHESPPAGVSS